MNMLKVYLKKFTWLIILVAVVLAFVFPVVGVVFKPYVGYLLMALMFFSCIGIDLKMVMKGLKRPWRSLMILGVVHVLSAGIVMGLHYYGLFSDEIFLGLILATVTSSGLSVIFLTSLFGGETSKSLVISSASNILAPISMPFLVYLFARTEIQVDAIGMAWTITKFVILPLIAAALVRRTQFDEWLEDKGTYISIGILFLIIIGIVAGVRDVILENIELSLFLSGVVTVLVSLNFLVGYLLGKGKKEKIAFAISASYKNFTLSTVIALALFGPLVALPSLIYTVVNNVLLVPIQFICKSRK